MNWRQPAGRRKRQLLDDLHTLTTPRHRTPLLVLIWHWWKELVLLTAIATLGVAVLHALGLAWAVAGLSVMIGVFSPPWTEGLKACSWQFITPHLLRAGLREARIQNLRGHRPVIVRVTRESFGERVRLWCPAGICAEDLQAARRVLRAACWATDVWVTRDVRRSHMVTVDVIRHPASPASQIPRRGAG